MIPIIDTLNKRFDIIKQVINIHEDVYTILLILRNHITISSNVIEELLQNQPYSIISVSEVIHETERFQQIVIKSFETLEQKQQYEITKQQNEIYDHRRLFESMELGKFLPEHPGFVTLLPRGLAVFNNIKSIIRSCYQEHNYIEVRTPPMMNVDLWKKTGHHDKYQENMFIFDNMALKPMSCPAHTLLLHHLNIHELPIRIAEFGECFRNESPGGLQGLKRARFLTQDDGHIFCMLNHIPQEIEAFLVQVKRVYKLFGFENIKLVFATRPTNFYGNIQDWNEMESMIIDHLRNSGHEFEVTEGEGAFYGPKIECHIPDKNGKYWQCGTIQVDWLLTKSLNIKVNDIYPITLHRAILGSIERFTAMLLEQHHGLPIICNDIKVACIVLKGVQNEYIQNISDKIPIIIDNNIQHDINSRIKKWIAKRPNYLVVIGPRDIANNVVTARINNEQKQYNINDFICMINEQISYS